MRVAMRVAAPRWALAKARARAERSSRVDDLGLLVELIDSSWSAVDDRLRRIEESLHQPGATVYRIGEAS